MVYKSSPRGTRPVSLLAVHTAEGARTARALAAYFYRDDVMASSHDAIDGKETIHMVPYHRASWTLRSGNPISDNVELCGFARWSRGQWLSTGVVDGVGNPRAMLGRLADWIRVRARARGIPVRKLSVVELSQGHWGVIAHDDWTRAKNDGTHWDPGPGFPWDVVMAMVNPPEPDPIQEDDMSVIFAHGDSNTPIPGTSNTYGQVVFKLEFTHGQPVIAVRTRVPNPNEPGFVAWKAAGRPVVKMPQAALDDIPDKFPTQD